MKQFLLIFALFSFSLVLRAQSATNLRVFPNPTTDYVQVSGSETVATIGIYNLAGVEVRNFEFDDNKRYFVGDLPRGMYLIQFLGPKRERLVTRRLNIR